MKQKKIAAVMIFGFTVMLSACKAGVTTCIDEGTMNLNDLIDEINIEENTHSELEKNANASSQTDVKDAETKEIVNQQMEQQAELNDSEVKTKESENEAATLESEENVSQVSQKDHSEETKDSEEENKGQVEGSLMIDEADGTSTYQVGEPIWNDAEIVQDQADGTSTYQVGEPNFND